MNEYYKMYLKERENSEVLDHEYGFAIYTILDESIYLSDIFVVPEKRRSKVCYDMADSVSKIGRDNGCKYILGTIDANVSGVERSVEVLKNYGFKVFKVENSLVWYKKEI